MLCSGNPSAGDSADLRMPDMDGLAVPGRIRTSTPGWSDYAGGGAIEELENQARKLRVTDFFERACPGCAHTGAVHRVAQQV